MEILITLMKNLSLKWMVVIALITITAVGLIWFIAHSTAEPGEKVSILFGLVEYTKGKSQIGSRSEPRIQQKTEPPPKERKVQETLEGPKSGIEVGANVATDGRDEISGSITFPHYGERVVRRFRIEGTVLGKYRHLWLVEQVGQLYWPKEPELKPQNGRWIGEVNEGGWPPGGKFKVLLVDVSDEVSSRFQEWLENGHRTGNYPGLTSEELGEDVNILDSKEYQLLTE